LLWQRPGGIRGWSSAVLAFDSTRGFPGEGPPTAAASAGGVHRYFAKPTALTSTTAPESASSAQPSTTGSTDPTLAAPAVDPVVAPVANVATTTNPATPDHSTMPDHSTIYSASRQYLAQYDSSGDRWRLCSQKPKCHIGTRKSRSDAILDLDKLDAGTHKSQNKQQKPLPDAKRPCRIVTAPAAYANPAFRDSAGAPPPLRIEVAGGELSKLQERVLFDLNSVVKARDRRKKD
jgi:hypothetical protein